MPAKKLPVSSIKSNDNCLNADVFESLLAHELRTPLTIIKSYLWMVNAGKAGPVTDGQKSYINKALFSTEKLIYLVSNFIDLIKMEKGDVRYDKNQLDIVKLCKEVATEFTERILQKKLAFNLESDKESNNISGDYEKLKKAVRIIIENTVKHTKSGKIMMNIEESDQEVLVSIQNSDTGLDSSGLKRLFRQLDLFNSENSNSSNISEESIALYIAKKYIEGMGGKTGVNPGESGQGSVFWFILPKS